MPVCPKTKNQIHRYDLRRENAFPVFVVYIHGHRFDGGKTKFKEKKRLNNNETKNNKIYCFLDKAWS